MSPCVAGPPPSGRGGGGAVGCAGPSVRLTLPEKPRSIKPLPCEAALAGGSKDGRRQKGKLAGEAIAAIPPSPSFRAVRIAP